MSFTYPITERGAVLKDGYRYTLWRTWNKAGESIVFVMLNPSVADMQREDPTLTRCINFAQAWNYGSLELVNLFAHVTPFSKQLKQARAPIGMENDASIQEAVARTSRVVVAWGEHGSYLERDRAVLALLPRDVWCMGTNKDGSPRHPLYLRNATILIPFQPAPRLSLVKKESEAPT